jgi:hypothetical protein
MASSGMCRCAVLLRNDVSEECITSVFKEKTINSLRTIWQFVDYLYPEDGCDTFLQNDDFYKTVRRNIPDGDNPH